LLPDAKIIKVDENFKLEEDKEYKVNDIIPINGKK